MKRYILFGTICSLLMAAVAFGTTYKSKGGKNDLEYWGGTGTTFSRRTSGSDLTVRKIGNVVDVAEAYGSGSVSESALTTAISTIGTGEATLELAKGTWPLTANLTVPANISIHMVRGAYLSLSSGVTLTMNGSIYAEEDAWYSSTGTVTMTGAEYLSTARMDVEDDLKVGDDFSVAGSVKGAVSFADTVTVIGPITTQSTFTAASTASMGGSTAVQADGTSVIDLPYSTIYTSNDTITINTANTNTRITWDSIGSENVGITASTDGSFTIETGYAGAYLIIYNLSVAPAGSGDDIRGVMVSSTSGALAGCFGWVQTTETSYEHPLASHCIQVLADGEAVYLTLNNLSATDNVLIQKGQMSLVRVGF